MVVSNQLLLQKTGGATGVFRFSCQKLCSRTKHFTLMADLLDFSCLWGDELPEEEDDDYDPEQELEQEDDDEEEEEAIPSVESSEQSLDDLIARRTRSKHHVTDEVGDRLDLPDIEPDLYGSVEHPSEGDDVHWNSFLRTLYTEDLSFLDDVEGIQGNYDDDDEEDPEFVPPVDVEVDNDQEVIHRQRVITKKEISSLQDDESKTNFCDITSISDRTGSFISGGETLSSSSTINPMISLDNPLGNEVKSWAVCFDESLVKQLQDQLAVHVQLLSQSYLLCREKKTLINEAKRCSQRLLQLRDISKTNLIVKSIPNIPQAISILERLPLYDVKFVLQCFSWRKAPLSQEIRNCIMDNPQVFVCQDILPVVGFYDVSSDSNSRSPFSDIEDHLIAMGLEYYSREDGSFCAQLIRENLLPSKAVQQIKTRVKNLKARRGNFEDKVNPIIIFYEKGHLPKTTLPFKVVMFRSSFDIEKGPEWLKKYYPSHVMNSSQGNKRSFPSPVKQANAIVKKYKRHKRTQHNWSALASVQDFEFPRIRSVCQERFPESEGSTTKGVGVSETALEEEKEVAEHHEDTEFMQVDDVIEETQECHDSSSQNWSMENDRILLSLMQQWSIKSQVLDSQAFEETAKKLKKSRKEVSDRFSELMRLLREGSS